MTDPQGSSRPAPKRRRRPAQGARYLVTGISASAVLGGITAFGIADLRAAQAESAVPPTVDPASAAPVVPAAAPASTPAPIIKIVIRRSGDPSASTTPAPAPRASVVGAAVPAAPVAAPAPRAQAPAASRSKAS